MHFKAKIQKLKVAINTIKIYPKSEYLENRTTHMLSYTAIYKCFSDKINIDGLTIFRITLLDKKKTIVILGENNAYMY